MPSPFSDVPEVKWHGFSSESNMWARPPQCGGKPCKALIAYFQVPREILLEMGHLRLIQREVRS